MNYIKEINAFDDWLETNQLSASAISFYRAIMQVANKTGWKASFAVAISTIESKTGFKRSALYQGRNQLAQKGRLKFYERGGNQSAVYEIIPFCVHLTDTTTDTLADTVTDTTTDAGRTQSRTINKLNNKQKETDLAQPPKNDNPPKNKSEVKPVAPPFAVRMVTPAEYLALELDPGLIEPCQFKWSANSAPPVKPEEWQILALWDEFKATNHMASNPNGEGDIYRHFLNTLGLWAGKQKKPLPQPAKQTAAANETARDQYMQRIAEANKRKQEMAKGKGVVNG